jgi:hypothetical protein
VIFSILLKVSPSLIACFPLSIFIFYFIFLKYYIKMDSGKQAIKEGDTFNKIENITDL